MSAFFKAVELMIINLEVLKSISEVPIEKKNIENVNFVI